IAHDLGVADTSLQAWVRQANADAGVGGAGDLTTAEREELHRLRREVKVLEQERAILKKAAACCAREIRCVGSGLCRRSRPTLPSSYSAACWASLAPAMMPGPSVSPRREPRPMRR